MASVIWYIRRAVAFCGLESSAKLRRGRPLGPILFGSAVWQVLQCTPSEPCHFSMASRTCSPERFLGRTLRLVGAGKVRGGLSPGGGGRAGAACGAWAVVVTAKRVAMSSAVAAKGRDRGDFKLEAS